jgi:hypothetical protein
LLLAASALHHLLERQPVLDQLARVDLHLVLLLVAAPGGDVVDARRGAQDQPHGPVLQRAQVHRAELLVGVDSIVYQNTWPRPELLGPSSGSP